jgi:hypothetical protein
VPTIEPSSPWARPTRTGSVSVSSGRASCVMGPGPGHRGRWAADRGDRDLRGARSDDVAWLVLPVDRSFPSGGPGRGLGTEAACVMCDWLFGSAGAERIESSTAVSNSRMRGVFDKLGFGFDGVKRRWDVDRAHYSVSREQWNVDRS